MKKVGEGFAEGGGTVGGREPEKRGRDEGGEHLTVFVKFKHSQLWDGYMRGLGRPCRGWKVYSRVFDEEQQSVFYF